MTREQNNCTLGRFNLLQEATTCKNTMSFFANKTRIVLSIS